MWTFFGLGLDYKPILHKQLFDIVYFSKGAFTHDDVYCMPIYLRTFYYGELSKQLDLEKEAVDKANGNGSNSKPPSFSNIPDK
mgnify:CR=1 FL=1